MYTSYHTSHTRTEIQNHRSTPIIRAVRQQPRYQLITAVTVFVALFLISFGAFAKGAPDSFADLAERLSPAVVNISSTQIVKNEQGGAFPQFPPGHPLEDFFKDFGGKKGQKGPRERKATSLGSGFIIDKEGIVVTNNHVIDGADEIFVIFQDGEKVPATLVGRDKKTDLAVLRIDAKDRELVAVPWGNSDKSRVGDWVLAIGNPFGLGGTVTAGIISARGRDIRSGPYDDYIQTDASINKGNSGGPLFNMKGEVIGINTAIFSQSGGSVGIGFSIPSQLASKVVAQLREFGKTSRGWLGVVIQNVTDELAEGLGLGNTDGVLVAGVPEDGPAFKAGIKAGDVILTFNKKRVRETRELSRAVAETPVASEVKVQLWRNGEKITKTVKLGELEKAETQFAKKNGKSDDGHTSATIMGMTLSTVDDRARQQFKLSDDAEGVVVVGVEQGSEAAEKNIQPGDQILEVQLKPVSTVADVEAALKGIKETDRKSVLMLVRRGLSSRFVALSVAK